ncbi:RasGAP protein [Kickxella alabastrina]|uniref:RasGAP protein n=1 Tax=Kickxella alabastrina TaxID=61397 RepID=A0ACC1IWH6_9FUNG|nr:RasGAP protein [Kickxella alabastrina]
MAKVRRRKQHQVDHRDTADETSPNQIESVPVTMPSKKEKEATDVDAGAYTDADATPSSWLNRLWYGIRKNRESPPSSISSSSSSRKSRTKLSGNNGSKTTIESGAILVGLVKDPNAVIPAHVMFSSERASLYSTMVTLLVHNPSYLSRVISHVKYHECDALLSIVLDSVFGSPAYEPALTALFTEIIEIEVDRTTTIDTVMRNDAPSVHMLSAYLRKQSCLEYLHIAVGPTIQTIVKLGTSTSLDPDLVSVYQDWARTQPLRKLPLVVSESEAASYTEVQNLSRRRHRHLTYLATHCLGDITRARKHIPLGLLSICRSTLRATKRKFPQVDQAKAFSLVGGIFFLRFVNAALTSPNQYGLLDIVPQAAMKTNLKLVARLIQRLSNNSAKPVEEWPVDERRFMRANVSRFHSFLGSLTMGASVALATVPGAEVAAEAVVTASINSAVTAATAAATAEDAVSSDDERVLAPRSRRFRSMPDTNAVCNKLASAAAGEIIGKLAPEQEKQQQLVSEVSPDKGYVRSLYKEDTAIEVSFAPTVASPMPSSGLPSLFLRPLPPLPHHKSIDQPRTAHSSSLQTTHLSLSTENFSVQTMGNTPNLSDPASALGSRQGSHVVLALNDLYLLQKYLVMYEDAWMPGEQEEKKDWMELVASGVGGKKSLGEGGFAKAPMRMCIDDLGPAPAQVPVLNNHRTRIPLMADNSLFV